ncbi:MAG: alpha-ketoglutarate-dependent dioxygenase AlkB [Pseudomonadota bacterium]
MTEKPPLPGLQPAKREIAGFRLLPGHLDEADQATLVGRCREVIRAAPLVRPRTAWGKSMSVRMTSAGRVGWVIDKGRYRYSDVHPETGQTWPPIPAEVLAVWTRVSGWPDPPDCCLLNWYDENARMGLHQDKDEGNFEAPVVSISLGDPARFRMGGTERGGKTQSVVLTSGDVMVMGGAARLAYHGIDRLITDDPPNPLTGRGRINLTLRVVAG